MVVFGDDMHNKTKPIAIVTITVVIIASFVFLSLPNALAEEDTITSDIKQRMGNFTKKKVSNGYWKAFPKEWCP